MLSCRELTALAAVGGLLFSSSIALAAEPGLAGFNTVGYLPDSIKQATVPLERDGALVIRDANSGAEVLRVSVDRVVADTDGNRGVGVADFSSLRRAGKYELVVPGRDGSVPFEVAGDVYNWPFYCVARGMYLSRCGTKVAGQFAGESFHHAECHGNDGYLDFAGGQPGTRKDATGGWHDAGDYNKYTVNAVFTAGTMLAAWEHFHDRLDALNLDLPESGNTTPDFLDEVRWGLEWLLKMQADDGSVYHKLSARRFNGFELPEKEQARRYFGAWSSAATASFAAVMAQAGRVFHPFDAEFSERCLAAAEKSFRFLEAHREDHRPDQSAFDTGTYDTPDADDRLWAASELWETTGKNHYLRDFELRLREEVDSAGGNGSIVDIDWDWGNLRNLGFFTYVRSKREGRSPELLAKVRSDVVQTADAIVKMAAEHPYRRLLGERYYWGSNGVVGRLAMNLEAARQLTGDEKYRGAMLDALHFLFGRNPYGRSLVTGLGSGPPLYPHDRRSGGDEAKHPWPGYLVGGPWPKATDWKDVEESYQTNEIAINWNAALIYALAAFVEPEGFADSVAQAKAFAASADSGKAFER